MTEDYTLATVLEQIDKAQRLVGLLERRFDKLQDDLRLAKYRLEDVKIELDSAHTNLRDIMGLPKEKL